MVILTLIPNSYIIIKIIPLGYNAEVKMYKKLLIISTTIIIIFSLFFVNKSIFINKNIENTDYNIIKEHKNELSMMLETTPGSGEYEKTTASEWPTEGYIFNSELSKCENGGELSWDDENNRVIMSGNNSDKCYVYFDMINLITFTIDGSKYHTSDIKKYYAELGMTWGEWIKSNYNVDGFYSGQVGNGDEGWVNVGWANESGISHYYVYNSDAGYDNVYLNDVIIENKNYVIVKFSEPI